MRASDPTTRKSLGGRRRPRVSARAEDGIMLVELLMASVLVALVSVGVFTAIVGSSRGSANDRHRSIAAALAQQDQERMRAFKATDLSNYRASRPVAVAGTTYTVVSRGQWVSDSSGVLSCSSGSSQANYMHITSTVSWPSMGSLKPIAVRSLVAPPAGSFSSTTGALAVKITDQANNPVSGLGLALSAGINDSTDSSGCAVFGGVTAGNYTLSYSQPGYVDTGGTNAISQTVSVTASATTTDNALYAQAGSIATSFDTKVGASPAQAAQSQYLTVAHNDMPAPGRRTFDPPGGGQTTISATSLFPFTSGYGVYAGNCAANDPTLYDANYYTQPGPGDRRAGRQLRRHGARPGDQDPHPPQRRQHRRDVHAREADIGRLHRDLRGPDQRRVVRPAGTGAPVRHLPGVLGLRFQTSAITTRRRTVTGIANTSAAGTAVTDIDVPTSGSSSLGQCT